MPRQDTLNNAKSAKNDEFYTQYEDIEKEINSYIEFDKDVFRDKTILCPCDDPEWSNFTKYFAANFERFGLKKLISTSYAKGFSNKQISLFELNSPKYNKDTHDTHGKIFILDRELNNSKHIDVEDIEFEYLQGDGDFRNEEIKSLKTEADIIVTNPPFSLFREFLSWICEDNKKFLIIGNINCITYNEVFSKIRLNEIWLGTGMGRWISGFIVPDKYELYGTEASINSDGKKIISTNNCLWLTNLEHERRHQKIELMTMKDNLKYNRKLINKLDKNFGDNSKYPHYDNYEAIEVPFTEAIPKDYDGIMGVPITFLDKYNPEEFQIIGISGDLANPIYIKGHKKTGRFYINNIRLYDRIAIQKKKGE